MIIDEKHIISFLYCNYKYHLDKNSNINSSSEFDTYIKDIISNTRKSIANYEQVSQLDKNQILMSNIKNGHYADIPIETNTSKFRIDFLSKIENNQFIIGQLYSNIFPFIDYKLLLAWKVYCIQKVNDNFTISTYLINQEKQKTHIRFSNKDFLKVETLLENFGKQTHNDEEPTIVISEKCGLCGAKEFCREKAIKNNDLSLLGSIKDSQIKSLNKKGIFSVTQLSYTFKPRRQLKKTSRKIKTHHVALKALAIREKKVFLFEKINLPSNRTHIYVDIETIPHIGKIYLISCILVNNNAKKNVSFWCDINTSEIEIFEKFLDLIKSVNNILIIHYGSMEQKFFKKLHSIYKNNTTKRILDSSCDLLSLIHPSVYFPTYTNGLKDILKFIGFEWGKNLEGYKSVLSRLLWEESGDEVLKEDLISYNIDDCNALIVLYQFLENANEFNFKKNPELESKIIQSSEIINEERKRRYGGHLFDKPNFILENFDFINKCSYFDYQRNKIIIKSNKTLLSRKKILDRQTFPIKVNKSIELNKIYICPFCNVKDIRISKKQSKRVVIDLEFFECGIKRWTTEYISYSHQCRICNKSFYPKKFRLFRRKYGHNLLSWVIYNHIVNRISFGKIEKTLATSFKISVGFVGSDTIYHFKTIAANYYKLAYHRILNNISNWKVLHIDETKARIQGIPAYVWVFTNGNEVAYILTLNRKTDFLNKLLKNFKGVLVSDFYKGYDSLKCNKQKCLVHLMRDINDGLFKEQQNQELKTIAKSFASILTEMITTANSYGLKMSMLNKHSKNVELFFHSIEQTSFDSITGVKLKKRILKYKDELFTFMNFDDIPWSNNTAEHAFRHFADYRKVSNGIYTESGLKNYLILLSVFETCRYKEIDFFSFLTSREKYIENYERKYTNRGNLRKGCNVHRLIKEFE